MDFLSRIMERTRDAIRCADVPLATLRADAESRSDQRRFASALADRPGIRIIAEIKRASPSKGDIDPELDPAQCAHTYQHGGAAAVSVLTEPAFFRGSLDDLRAARAACDLPVLRKDFLFDPYQIYEAAAAGADAVLLIVRILERQQLSDLLELTHQLGMDALVEVHSEDDIEKVLDLPVRVVGINNRDLQSFDTDLDRAKRIATLLPAGTLPVTASGIFARTDIERYLPEIRCFLIGESIVRAPDRVEFLRQLGAPTGRIRSAEPKPWT